MKLKILFNIHLFYPRHCAGAESYVCHLAEYLLTQGHECSVLLNQAEVYKIDEPYEYHGIKVYPFHKGHAWDLFHWCTHVISHLEYTPLSIQWASLFRKPVFFISHNTWDYPCINQRHLAPDDQYPVNVIYNSQWMAEKLNYPQRSIVLHPPLNSSKVDPEIRAEQNEYITLINCNERKGGSIFKELVKRMPEKKFLCVTGAYDEQIIPQKPNVTCGTNDNDVLKFYRMTRIMLIPSAYESWGMVASEAMANGIPVICSATPGLKENVAEAGIIVNSPNMQRWMDLHEPPKEMNDQDAIHKWLRLDRTPAMDVLDASDIDMWEEQIRLLDNENNYFAAVEKQKKRIVEQDPTAELQAVEKFIQDATKDSRYIACLKRYTARARRSADCETAS